MKVLLFENDEYKESIFENYKNLRTFMKNIRFKTDYDKVWSNLKKVGAVSGSILKNPMPFLLFWHFLDFVELFFIGITRPWLALDPWWTREHGAVWVVPRLGRSS
jgi:hypothetical protein